MHSIVCFTRNLILPPILTVRAIGKTKQLPQTPPYDNKQSSAQEKPLIVISKKGAQTLSVMAPPDRLGHHLRHVQDVQLGPERGLVGVLRDAVGRHQFVDAAVLDALRRVAAEDAVGHQGIDGGRPLLFEELGGAGDLGDVD